MTSPTSCADTSLVVAALSSWHVAHEPARQTVDRHRPLVPGHVLLERLEDECAALHWALTGGDTELALRLAGALTLFWRMRGSLSHGRQWLTQRSRMAHLGDATTMASVEG